MSVHLNGMECMAFTQLDTATTCNEEKTAANCELWGRISADNSRCWDNGQFKKRNCRGPDFFQSSMKETLFIDGWRRSSLIKAEMIGLEENEDQSSFQIRTNYLPDLKANFVVPRLSKSCDAGWLDMTLQAIISTDLQLCHSSNTSYHLSKKDDESTEEQDLATRKDFVRFTTRRQSQLNPYFGSFVIPKFTKCKNLSEANEVFINLSNPSVFAWSEIISAHLMFGQNEQAIDLFYRMLNSKVEPDGYVYIAVLKACSNIADLEQGKEIHSNIIETGLESDLFVGSALIDMYGNCGSLEDAQLVFDRMTKRDMVIWSALIGKYTQDGQLHEAFQLFQQMKEQGMEPGKAIYACLLKASCRVEALEYGRLIHSHIIASGSDLDLIIGSTLVDMYAKCGSLKEAYAIFDRLPSRNVVTWSALIAGCNRHGHFQNSVCLFLQMQREDIKPNQVTFVSLLKVCSGLEVLELGKQIHIDIVKSGFELDLCVGSALIDMYAKCGSLDDAQMLFNRLPRQDVVTWSVLIVGYTMHGHAKEALWLHQQMGLEGVKPNQGTFVCLLKACSVVADLDQGKLIHTHVIESGFESDIFVGNTLIDLYAKCGRLEDACLIFNRLQKRDGVTWNALITGYAQHGHVLEVFQLLQRMQHEGVEPDVVTFICIVQVCSNVAALEQGKQIHIQLTESGFGLDLYVCNALIDMYNKCGSLDDACIVFEKLQNRDLVTWNSLIIGYAQHGHGEEALRLYKQMQLEGMKPNQVTFICILQACSRVVALEQGKWVHTHIIDGGFETDLFVSSMLINMYAKCKSPDNAYISFARLPERNVVTWNSLIAGFVQNGQGQEALQIFQQMEREGFEPNNLTFVSILQACASIAALEKGKQIHSQIIKHGFDCDSCVGNTIVDMYAKCGSMKHAQNAFQRLKDQDVVSWSVLIRGYAKHSNYISATKHFEEMQQAGIKPDGITFLCLFTACSNVGQVGKGCHHFKSMRDDYNITITLEHYNSMVDLFGQAGLLNEAEDLLETLPFRADIAGWTSMLGSCRKYGNVELGRRCFDHVVALEGRNATGYVLMSNIYTCAAMQQDARDVEELRRSANVWKKPGKAFIEVNKEVHVFTVGEITHSRSEDIYAKLRMLSLQMREEGYEPHLDLVLDSVSEADKSDALCGHCEKLAIAFGLLCTPQGSTIRVAKNLKMCPDCHNVAKIISKIERREIIVSDANRIHCFQDGTCCCKDYN